MGRKKEFKLLSETLREKNEIVDKDVQYLKVENENLKAQLKDKKK